MSKEKKYTKKLTDAGNAVCILSAISLILALVSSFTEPVATSLYNTYYAKQQSHFLADSFDTFVDIYEKSVILVVFSLVVFIVAVSGRNKKKIGGGFSVLTLIIPVLLAIKPAMLVADTMSDGSFANAFKTGSDGDKFRAVISLSANVIPIICAFFLLLCGVILTGRILCEEFSAEVPLMKRINVTTSEGFSQDINKPLVKEETVKSVEPQFEFTHDPVDSDLPFRKPDGNVKSVSADIESEKTNENTEKTEVSEDKADNGQICKECGKKLADGAKFCKNCGRPVF